MFAVYFENVIVAYTDTLSDAVTFVNKFIIDKYVFDKFKICKEKKKKEKKC